MPDRMTPKERAGAFFSGQPTDRVMCVPLILNHDARVAGLGDYFVGERVRVWISGDERPTFIVPAAYVVTRFGLDYARVRNTDGTVIDVPVQRGRGRPRPDMPDALEILSGLRPGDVLVQP